MAEGSKPPKGKSKRIANTADGAGKFVFGGDVEIDLDGQLVRVVRELPPEGKNSPL